MSQARRQGGLLNSGFLPWVQTALLVCITMHTWPNRVSPQPGPSPSPTPIDDVRPQPSPAPQPVAEGAKVIVLHQNDDDDTDRAKRTALVMQATAFWDGLEARGLDRIFYDIDQLQNGQTKAKAEAMGLPVLLIQSASNEVLRFVPLPATGNVDADLRAVDKIVREATGR